MHAVYARQLVRQYAPGRGVCGISLAVAQGQCYAVLGRNGSGKTTLTRLLLGLERPAAGELTVLGCAVGAGSRNHLAACGAALDHTAQWEALSGRDNAHFVARAYGLGEADARARIDELFALADLTEHADDPVAIWSFGMRRKLAIIQAMLHEPDLLILDEPTAGLDAHFVLRLGEQIRRRSRDGRTTWLAGNDPDFAGAVATRVAFIDAGQIVAEAAPDALLAELDAAREVRMRLATPAALAPPQIPAVRSFRVDGDIVTATVDDDARAVARLIEHVASCGGDPRSVQVRRPTLRDAFLRHTGRAIDDGLPKEGPP